MLQFGKFIILHNFQSHKIGTYILILTWSDPGRKSKKSNLFQKKVDFLRFTRKF